MNRQRELSNLMDRYERGELSRRAVLARALALGIATPLGGLLSRGAGSTAAQQATPATAAAASVGGAADTITFGAYNVDQAPLNVQNGDVDLYIFGLKTAGAKSLEGNDQVRLIDAPASTVSLLLNPAPAPDGALNPFSIKEVRQAMQYLIDRDFIASDIYQGRALPMFTNISPTDYDQLTIFPVVSAANIRYDNDLATKQITDAMTAAGASKDGGTWSFGGKPIQIKIVTRVEDERRDIGDLVRSSLEQLGFQVAPQYQEFGPATLAVYASDPKTFQWHIYTEGWSRARRCGMTMPDQPVRCAVAGKHAGVAGSRVLAYTRTTSSTRSGKNSTGGSSAARTTAMRSISRWCSWRWRIGARLAGDRVAEFPGTKRCRKPDGRYRERSTQSLRPARGRYSGRTISRSAISGSGPNGPPGIRSAGSGRL